MKIILTDNVGRSLSMRTLALSGAWNCRFTCLFHFAQNYYGTKKALKLRFVVLTEVNILVMILECEDV